MRCMPDACFIMPHYREHPLGRRWLRAAIASLFAQTDDRWRLVLVDDASPDAGVRVELNALRARFPERIHVLYNRARRGPGYCRNRALRYAARLGAEIALFLDADDTAHPARLVRTRAVFARHRRVDVVYSPFRVIDELGRTVPAARLSPSIRQIQSALRRPPTGEDVWLEMGLRSGYVNLTSATSVRIALALRQPFPAYHVSEDFHTWMRYAAAGRRFYFIRSIPAGYRIPSGVRGSHSRRRMGGEFYRRKARVDAEGFEIALRIAHARGRLREGQVAELRRAFAQTLCRLLAEEGMTRDEVARMVSSIQNEKNIQSSCSLA